MPAEEGGAASTLFAAWAGAARVSVPDPVTGPPETDSQPGAARLTDVTVPEPAVGEMSIVKSPVVLSKVIVVAPPATSRPLRSVAPDVTPTRMSPSANELWPVPPDATGTVPVRPVASIGGRSAMTRPRNAGTPPPPGAMSTSRAAWVASERASVPEEVTGEPETEKTPAGADSPTEETPPPPPEAAIVSVLPVSSRVRVTFDPATSW